MYSDKVVPAIKNFLRKPLTVYTFVLYVVVSVIEVINGLINMTTGNPDNYFSVGFTVLFTAGVIITYGFAVSKNFDSIDTSILNTMRKCLMFGIAGVVILIVLSLGTLDAELESLLMAPLMVVFGIVYVFVLIKGMEFLDSIICAIESSYPDTSAPRIVGTLQFVLAFLSVVSAFVGTVTFLGVIISLLNCAFYICFGIVIYQYLDYMKRLRQEIIDEDNQKKSLE